MSGFLRDMRYAVRVLRKDLGFSAVAILTLALGIGANTAIFSLVNGVLLRPLPYPEPGRLVRVFTITPTQPHFPMAIADFYDYRDQTKVFASSALYAERDLDLTTNERPEHLSGLAVTHEYFRVLGYHPILGRDFDSQDEYKKSDHVVILGERLWRTRFDSDPAIVGKALVLSGQSFTVIGVMPAGIQHVGGDYRSPAHGETVDLWWPLPLLPHDAQGCDRGCHYLNMVARLASGVTPAEASAALNADSAQMAKLYPQNAHQILIVPLKEEIVGRARLMLSVLMGAVGFLLLIACVNVANLALSRATGRSREIAMRSVLGAGGWRIVRQLLTESFLLASFGCLLGVVLAIWGVDALVALSPDKLPRLQAVHVDASVLLFAVFATVLTSFLFGLAPALSIMNTDVNQSLKDGDRGATSGGGRGRLRNWLVATEMALALMLLVGAGLLMRTFVNLEHVQMGFNPEHVLTFQTDLPGKRYPKDAMYWAFYKNLAARLQALPGVQSVGFGSDIPWTGYDDNTDIDIEGRPSDPNHPAEARYHYASPGYFEAAGIPLLSGRLFNLADDQKSPRVVVVNSAFSKRFFPDEDGLGKRLDLWGFKGVQIVGVVGDVKDTPDAGAAKPAFYWPDWQFTDNDVRVAVIRSNSNLASLASAVRRGVSELDKDLPVTDVQPMDEVTGHALSTAKFTWMLVALFAGLAMLLAAIGIFGVMSYSVTQRTHEIGIRMALGAQESNVLSMVVSHGLKLAAFGVVAGLIASFVLTRAMRSLLYGVSAFDPWTFVAVAGLLMLVALLACYVPARRASKTDPIEALRYE
ncbi:MAG TPA: ABC transporter permease [Candidatus Acidoferrum sp.]|nr:ABC transporter permease [Candidatus Acidoferrum sp.]